MTLETERQAGALMRLAQAGDQAAYASLLTLLATAARQFALSRLGAVAWIDDVVQDTLIAVHRYRHTYDPARPFAPWFFAIASSRLVDAVRRERRIWRREVQTDTVPDVASPKEDSGDHITADAVRAALVTLPARQREIVEQLKFEGRSVREVARRLGMSESAVKVTAHRGYKALRRVLGQRDRGH